MCCWLQVCAWRGWLHALLLFPLSPALLLLPWLLGLGIICLDLRPSSHDKIREQLLIMMGDGWWVAMSAPRMDGWLVGWTYGWRVERLRDASPHVNHCGCPRIASWNNQFRFIRFSASRMQIKTQLSAAGTAKTS